MTPDVIAMRPDRAVVERRVLEIVEDLTAELGLNRSGRPVSLDDSLDRDLSLGSLERVELLLRLEESLGVSLPDRLLAEAESPRNLVSAVLAGEPVLRERPLEPIRPVLPGTPAPASASTLVEVLAWHAEVDRDRVHILLGTDGGAERPITYGELWQRSQDLAAGLAERGVRSGESVAIMLRTEEAFFRAFFGTLLAGAVPVPIYPPFRLDRLEEYARRQVGILDNAEARLLLTFGEAERLASLLRPRVRSLRDVVAVETLDSNGGTREGGGGCTPTVRPEPPSPNSPALIQYTSGSTGEPKGVLLSHANILANIRAMGEALAVRADDVAVSWLPLYHDMGLIGAWLGTLYYGIPVVILSPLAFLARPARWLWAIHAHRATFSAAPNFAFDLCTRKVGDDELRGLDLGSWRLALNGSEPVSPDTIEQFAERFAPYGFRREALCPVYGLAESSVGLAMSRPGEGARVDRVAREGFTRSRHATPAGPDDPSPLRVVSCGRPLPGHEIRVVDAGSRPVGERVEGRVEFRGPSVTSGYFRNPEATRAVLSPDDWMDSGDLGYWAEGDLFVTGRQKDVIIKAGRNLYPQEVEEIVGEIPGIRRGCVAAFGVPDPEAGTERLVVVAESRETTPDGHERLRARAVDRVVAALGIPPDIVVISPPGAILKTSSGKIRRGATREAFISGSLGRRRPALWTQRLHLVRGSVAARLGRLAEGFLGLAFAGWVGVLLLVTLPPCGPSSRSHRRGDSWTGSSGRGAGSC